MSIATSYVAIAAALIASSWCWWDIRRSGDPPIIKILLSLIVALPYLGPLIYLVVQLPPRRRPLAPPEGVAPGEKISTRLAHWHEREHIYFGWASVVFWTLAVLAYWMSDWSPGQIIEGSWGHFTRVDVIFFALLVGAVLTFGLAVRAKVVLERRLREAAAALLDAIP